MSNVKTASKYRQGRPVGREDLIEKTCVRTHHDVFVMFLSTSFSHRGRKVKASKFGLSL